ncbi:MAG TPA: FAD-dependent oxidoreductase [Solirubrobacteraceae bacterium]|nr:FAD-dependent oxidoreductase [Solirubrobacteraceae bacterium]
MTNSETYVIVGASLAGAKAAEELREQGFDGRVVLIGAEPERPYERPPLSKDYLRGESERAKAYVHDEGFYDDHDIELLADTNAIGLDARNRELTLSDARTQGFDKLLIATGAEPRRISVPGTDLDGIHYLRTLADCDALRERLDAGGRVAVVGAGWIGSEVAASARQRGLEVTLIDPLSLPNERIFGPEIGTFYRDAHASHGVELALGEGVEGFEGDGHVRGVRTSTGRVVECDFAVVGVGVVPRIALAQGAGLEIDNGIVVTERLETSAPGVFAAGDVANAWHPFFEQRIRVEHWANALNQGPAAARSMLGQGGAYDRIPYFFSDQYDVGMEYSGYATSWDEVVFRGDRDAGEFIAFWLKDSRVVAGMNVNVWDVNEHVQALIRSRREVDAAELAGSGTSLEELAAVASRGSQAT